MYEQMRNDILVELSSLDPCDIGRIIRVFDNVASNYEISRKSMSLMVCDDEIPKLVKTYLVCKKIVGLSEETISNYGTILKIFFNTVRKAPGHVTANDIRMFLYVYQEQRNISLRTLDKYREYIARFFTWTVDEGYLTTNPAKNVESIKYEEKPREALSQVQLEYLRKACNTPRELAIIEFLYSTGCRVSELSVIKKSDVDWNDLSVHLFGKGKKHRYSFLNAKAEVALKAYLETRTDDSEFLFVGVRKPHKQLHKDGIESIVRNISSRAMKDIGKNVTPHILRHTNATTALQRGMPIGDISKLLGHTSIETTMIYAKTSLDDVRTGHKKYVI